MPGDQFIELAMAENRHVLDVLFRHASEAITVQDRSGRVIYANDEAGRLMGLPTGADLVEAPTKSVLASYELIDEAGDPFPLGELPGRLVLEHGEPVAERIIGYRRKDSNDVRWSRLRASPIKDDAGQVVWAINFFLDITARMRRRQIESLLVAAQEQLVESLEVESVVETITRLIAPDIANWVGVHLLDDAGYLRAAAMVYPQTDDAVDLVTMTGQERVPLSSDRMQTRVFSTGEAESVLEVTDEALSQAEGIFGPDIRRVIEALDLNSVVCLPLRTGDRVIGTLTAARSGPMPPFDAEDLFALTALADRAGVTLANALLYSHEHEMAQVVSRALHPDEIPQFPGVEMNVRYLPQALISNVGGDFYDVIPLADGRCAIFLGDIEGKGIPAAEVVATVRQVLRATIAIDPAPSVVFRQLNDALLNEPSPRFCTLVYAVVDRADDKVSVEVSLAGHPPPVVVTSDGVAFEIGRASPPAGVMEHLDPYRDRVTLGPGDLVLLYTDGVLSRRQPLPERLSATVREIDFESLDELLDKVIGSTQGGDHPIADDVVVFGLRVAGGSGVDASGGDSAAHRAPSGRDS